MAAADGSIPLNMNASSASLPTQAQMDSVTPFAAVFWHSALPPSLPESNGVASLPVTPRDLRAPSKKSLSCLSGPPTPDPEPVPPQTTTTCAACLESWYCAANGFCTPASAICWLICLAWSWLDCFFQLLMVAGAVNVTFGLFGAAAEVFAAPVVADGFGPAVVELAAGVSLSSELMTY